MKRAEDVMNRNPLTVGSQLTVQALAQTLLDHQAEGALVLEGTTLVGVVTATDLAMRELDLALTAHRPADIATQQRKRNAAVVADLMSPDPVVVTPRTPMHEVARLMTEARYSIVPVLTQGELVGAITRRSVIAAAAAGGLALRDEVLKDV